MEIRCLQVESGMMSSSCVRVGPDPLLLSFHPGQMWMWKEEDSDGTDRGWEVAAAKQQPKGGGKRQKLGRGHGGSYAGAFR